MWYHLVLRGRFLLFAVKIFVYFGLKNRCLSENYTISLVKTHIPTIQFCKASEASVVLHTLTPQLNKYGKGTKLSPFF
jgi:hypothetical protein